MFVGEGGAPAENHYYSDLEEKGVSFSFNSPAKTCAEQFVFKQVPPVIMFQDEIAGLVSELESFILFGGRRCGKTTALYHIFISLLPKIAERKLLVIAADFRTLFDGICSEREMCNV